MEPQNLLQANRTLTLAIFLITVNIGSKYATNLLKAMDSSPGRYRLFFLRLSAAVIDLAFIALAIPYCTRVGKQISFNVLYYFGKEAAFGEGINEQLIVGSLLALAVAFSMILLSCFLASSFFFAITESLFGSSPGKKIIGLEVQRPNGCAPSLWRSTLRQSSKSLSALIFGLGFLMPLWTKRRQALHDKLAGCLVVCKRGPSLRRSIFGLVITAASFGLIYPSTYENVQMTFRRINLAVKTYRAMQPAGRLAVAIFQEGYAWIKEDQ